MLTQAQEFRRVICEATAAAERIASVDHSSEGLFPVLQTIGSTLERFLKGVVFPGGSGNLVELITKAESVGLSSTAAALLHRFRRDFYNKAKHEVSFSPSTSEVLHLLQSLNAATTELSGLGLGLSNQDFVSSSRRLFWLGFWDHYIGGDTEVLIALPISTASLPPVIDTVYIDMDAWDSLKIQLPQIGSFIREPQSVPASVYDAWGREEGLLAIASFEGSYSSLVQLLARYEKVEAVLPFLKRENQPNSMLSASLFATCQAAQTGFLACEALNDIRDEIFRIAESLYAAPRHSKLVQHYVASLADFVLSVPVDERAAIQGPDWVIPEDFRKHVSSGARMVVGLSAALTRDFRIVLQLPL